MTATVSVLCPVWNNASYLGEALASALGQTRPPDEIIVVDDGSTDESAALAESLPGVRVVRAAHRGVAMTRNTLIAEAKCDLVAFLDSDDRWTADKLEVQVGYMEAHPEIGVSYTHQRLRLESGVERPSWVTPEALHAATTAMGTCSMVARRSLFAPVGAFESACEPNEDTDWLVRAISLGYRHAMLPDVLLLRRVHARNLSNDSRTWTNELLQHLRRSIRRHRQ